MSQKTVPTNVDVHDFIESFSNSEQKKQDSYTLLKLMQEETGFEPVMWGPSIIGFGSYHYKYASGHEGDSALVGFSPRKSAISLYVFTGLEEHEHLLTDLGKFTMGKACIYVKKLSDVNLDVLRKVIRATIDFLQSRYENQ